MGSAALVNQLPAGAASHAAQAVVPDPDRNTLQAVWAARGRAHQRRVRRQFLTWIPLIAIGAAIAFALLRS